MDFVYRWARLDRYGRRSEAAGRLPALSFVPFAVPSWLQGEHQPDAAHGAEQVRVRRIVA